MWPKRAMMCRLVKQTTVVVDAVWLGPKSAHERKIPASRIGVVAMDFSIISTPRTTTSSDKFNYSSSGEKVAPVVAGFSANSRRCSRSNNIATEVAWRRYLLVDVGVWAHLAEEYSASHGWSKVLPGRRRFAPLTLPLRTQWLCSSSAWPISSSSLWLLFVGPNDQATANTTS